jgi:hypothetical protein
MFCVISHPGFVLNLYSRFGCRKPESYIYDEKQARIQNCKGACIVHL